MKKINYILLSILVPLAIVGLFSIIAFLACDSGLASNDCYEQYVPFMNAYYDILTGDKSMFYSLTGSMGYDFWAVFSYYLVSPLNFIILLFGKSRIIYAVNLLIILKLAFCGGTFSVFLKNRFPKAKTGKIVLFSTMYALCGFMAGYAWNIMWMDGTVLFPLVIMGLDVLMRDENSKWYWYTLFLSMLITISYFIGYMSCIFIFLYFFTYRFKNPGDFFKKLLKVGACSILSLGISAVILVPSFGGLQTTYITDEVLPKAGLYGSFVECFKTVMIGVPQIGITFDRNAANLFMTSLALLLSVVYFCTGSVKIGDKIRNAIMLGIIFFSFNFKPLNFIWHGLHEQTGIPNRFAFMAIFLMLIMAFEVTMKKRTEIKIASIWAGWGLVTALVLVMAFFDHTILVNAVLTSVLCLAYVLILAFGRGKIRIKFVRVFAYLEIIVMFGISFFYSNGTVLGDYDYYLSDFETINASKEPGFYREKIDDTNNPREIYFENVICKEPPKEYSLEALKDMCEYMRGIGHQSIVNEATVYGLNSMSLFNTFNNYALTNFYLKTGASGGTNNAMYYSENAFMDMLLGVKYYYTRYSDCKSSAYEYVNSVGNVDIYENQYALSVGYAIPEALLEEDIFNSNSFITMNNMSKAIAGVNVFDSVTFMLSKDRDSTDGTKEYEYTASKDGEYLIEANCQDIQKVDVYVDGIDVYNGTRGTQIIDAGMVMSGQKITVKITMNEPADTRATVIAAVMDNEAFTEVYKKLADEQLEISEYSDSYLKGKITLGSKESVLVTIPASKGWSIYVDGKLTEPDTFHNLFIVLNLDAGSHDIEMSYVTPGFVLGAKISVISLGVAVCALAITLIVSGYKKRKSKLSEFQN